MTDIIAISDISTTTQRRRRREAAASLSPLTIFFVDTCPHEAYLKHLLLHDLAQVIECASGEAEEELS